MADKKPITVFGAIAIVLLALGAFFFWPSSKPPANVQVAELSKEAPAEQASNIDVKAALSDRIMGDPNAPVKMSEHSSFTCGHCGAFHRGTFKKLKEAFVDTGKIYIVYSDFPLNAPALHASMVARCLPHDKYFDFVQMLFEKQDEWAYDKNYAKYLQEKSEEYGLKKKDFKACITNTELQEGIAARQKASQKQWNINSTPSFVLNNNITISGGRPFEEFEKLINAELAKSEGSTP